MKKQHVDHILRAAGRITGQQQFIIIGSQSLHGKYPDLADDIVRSIEVDLIAKGDPAKTELLNVIGVDSDFHDKFGYYADPVDHTTATLPKGWKGRLVNLPAGDTEGVRRLCLDPHDLAIAKYVARREKDIIFTRELARRGIVDQERLLLLLDQTAIGEEARNQIRIYIAKDFGLQAALSESTEPSTSLEPQSPAMRSSAYRERDDVAKESRQEPNSRSHPRGN
jgi:hypothetical protein